MLRKFAYVTGKDVCQSLFFNNVADFVKKETLAHVFSCEFCEISKNTYFDRTSLVTSSETKFILSDLFIMGKFEYTSGGGKH